MRKKKHNKSKQKNSMAETNPIITIITVNININGFKIKQRIETLKNDLKNKIQQNAVHKRSA